jgi:hypothetical protein
MTKKNYLKNYLLVESQITYTIYVSQLEFATLYPKKSQFTRIQITPAYNKCYSSVTNIIYNSIKYARLLIIFFVHAIL